MEKSSSIPLETTPELWSHILIYLLPNELGRISIVNKSLHSLISSIPTWKLEETEYIYMKEGMLNRRLTKKNHKVLLHPVLYKHLPSLLRIKKQIIGNNGDLTTIKSDIFTLPHSIYNTFTSFWDKSKQIRIPFENVVQYGQNIASNNINKWCFINNLGDTLSISRNMVEVSGMGNEAPNYSPPEEEKYIEFYEGGSEVEELDYRNQALMNKRQKALLENIEARKSGFKPFKLITDLRIWIIILCHGGKFSMAVYEGNKLIENRSDSKYVQRKKAGKRQINKDKTKGGINSVGSQMRRENEKMHQSHIAQILESEIEYIKQADVIFLHAPGINKTFFLGDAKPLKPYLHKIHPVLYQTQKANFTEAKGVFDKLTEVRLVLNTNLNYPQFIQFDI